MKNTIRCFPGLKFHNKFIQKISLVYQEKILKSQQDLEMTPMVKDIFEMALKNNFESEKYTKSIDENVDIF